MNLNLVKESLKRERIEMEGRSHPRLKNLMMKYLISIGKPGGKCQKRKDLACEEIASSVLLCGDIRVLVEYCRSLRMKRGCDLFFEKACSSS